MEREQNNTPLLQFPKFGRTSDLGTRQYIMYMRYCQIDIEEV